jgi:hypothetical protein
MRGRGARGGDFRSLRKSSRGEILPGLAADQGCMREALQAASLCGFVTGAMGIGLAVARSLADLWRGVRRCAPTPRRPTG